jgi:hypothetical protein
MDLYQQYNKEVVGAPRVSAGKAAWVWTENRYPKEHYTKIGRTASNRPRKGDVVVWNTAVNNGPGHIAVCQSAGADSFKSFDQNWKEPVDGAGVCKLQNHTYKHVLGWLRPKS